MPNLSTPIRFEKREPKAEGRTPNKKKNKNNKMRSVPGPKMHH